MEERKIIVIEYMSLDGVIQAPGGPTEDTSNNFTYGGWLAPFTDDVGGAFVQELMQPSDLLLGRVTFDIWENYWPAHSENWKGINDMNKYVLSTTKFQSKWKNSFFIKNLEEIEILKKTEGTDLKVWGSSKLVQSLLRKNLVDELWLLICPVLLGKGKKLFSDNVPPGEFELVKSVITPTGVFIANYRRKGNIKTGTVGDA
ncbi:MAG: dihydrofolate reductase family protein [Cyclobacteriaceae bacterium]|nr:dihydrofolate reductase family protein [Cyclobacteriaceae bacterium]UYN87275.1 MAG: dihydrofolate reductase family protein [Cyclobacteriaceae bacterium]